MGDNSRTTEVKVTHEGDRSNLLFDIDQDAANEALQEIFPGMGKLKIRVTDKLRDHYAAFMQLTDSQTVEVAPNSFSDIVEAIAEPKNTGEARILASTAKLIGQRIADYFDSAFSMNPHGYRSRDIIARDRNYYNELIASGADILTAQSLTMQRKAGEVVAHEIEHIKQSNAGAAREKILKGLKSGAIGFGTLIATTLALTVLSHSGQISITPEQIEKLMFNPAVLAVGWASALVPGIISIRNLKRLDEKGAYDKGFESGSKLVSAIHINEVELKKLLPE